MFRLPRHQHHRHHRRRLATFAFPATTKRNAPAASCYVDALQHEAKTTLSSAGALVVYSGAKTGRSPTDKRIVEAEPSLNRVWWGNVNRKLGQHAFGLARKAAFDFLETREKLYTVDGFAGADPAHRLKFRVVCSRSYHALFMQNMLIPPTTEELESFGDPDFTIYNAGQCEADMSIEGVTSKTLVALSFETKEVVILGTEYAGEMKKGIFTIMHYLMPLKGILSLHSSANEGKVDRTYPNRNLIGDDEHCWSDDGVFNIEGGCYAKAVDLSKEKEPEIYNAIRFGTVLENVVLDPITYEVDFKSRSITENTRVCYPITYIPNAKIPSQGSHPKNIIFLTCDAYGVLPPVSALTVEQTMYHFLSGYTSKVAGTEQGVMEPTATFSACFGAPFLVHPPRLYANMLAEKLKRHGDVKVWLLNTGWCGGAPGNGGSRIPLQYSRAIVDAIHSGELAKSIETKFDVLPYFDLKIPSAGVPGVPVSLFHPLNAWKEKGRTVDEYKSALKGLKDRFEEVMKETMGEGSMER
ncbi:Protein kinase C-like 1 [Rhizoclosmatium hyalinum]|nr:Protein kinase C-like 1 [Rhizoclosmatium hyalinum]